MHFSMLNVIVCAPILAGWLLVCGPWYLARYQRYRRCLRQQAGWARMEPGLAELDAELDRAWTAESERMRRRQ